MFKKIICAAAAGVLALSSLTAAAESEVKVYLNSRGIAFADQKPVIMNDRTLVPARGVFEEMGMYVDWKEDERRVIIRDSANKRVDLVIGSDIMEVYTFTAIFSIDNSHYTKEEIKLDCPAAILNDRTMIPLRAISEAFEAEVAWDEAARTVSIVSKDTAKVDVQTETDETGGRTIKATASVTDETGNTAAVDVPALYLAPDKTEAALGDEIKVAVKLSGFTLDCEGLMGITASINYDRTKLEFVSAGMLSDGARMENVLGGSNAEYGDGKLKIIYITNDGTALKVTDAAVAEVVFRVVSDEETQISLSADRTMLSQGPSDDTSLTYMMPDYSSFTLSEQDELYIDTTPVTIN